MLKSAACFRKGSHVVGEGREGRTRISGFILEAPSLVYRGIQRHTASAGTCKMMELPRYPPTMQTDVLMSKYVETVTNVVVTQPAVVVARPAVVILPPAVYPDYMTRSILNLIFCFFPLAILALIFSIKTREANSHLDSASAARYSSSAYSWNRGSSAVGFCIYITWIVCVIYFNV
ncbi:unnamed protein product [Ranitomeya imitator]|uniref:Uncharacterized protein n=1 Tax=Ranitomeya imitator TaxID=111125 RepID=A0ABN9KRN5_9NEOB|nr:unnamed protein product [Ranitomeya imitator]